jgi:hypothetical protein
VLAILGAGIATIVIVKLARRGKKYNSDYDTETIEDEINKRQQKSKIETNKTLDIKSDDDTEALKG